MCASKVEHLIVKSYIVVNSTYMHTTLKSVSGIKKLHSNTRYIIFSEDVT